MMKVSKILLPLLLIALAVGAVGVSDRLTLGKANLAFGSYLPWGLWVGLYIYLVGTSGGAFLVAFLHYGLGIAALRRPATYAVPIALLALGAGLLLVLLDLGQMGRFWYLYTRTSPTSILGIMVWAYTFYGLVLAAMLLAMAGRRRRALKWLAFAGMALVIVFGGGEGALFGVLGANPYWNSGILPIRFLFSAFLSGIGLVAFAVVLFRRWQADTEDEAAGRLFRFSMLALLALNLVFEFAEISVALYAGVPAVVAAHELIMFGDYWWVFWILQLGIGLLIPALVLASRLGRRPEWIGIAGLLIALGYAGTKQSVVLAGLSVPQVRGLSEAFVHPRLSLTYFPSATEWYVAVGVVGAAALAFILAIEILPFLRDHEHRGVDPSGLTGTRQP